MINKEKQRNNNDTHDIRKQSQNISSNNNWIIKSTDKKIVIRDSPSKRIDQKRYTDQSNKSTNISNNIRDHSTSDVQDRKKQKQYLGNESLQKLHDQILSDNDDDSYNNQNYEDEYDQQQDFIDLDQDDELDYGDELVQESPSTSNRQAEFKPQSKVIKTQVISTQKKSQMQNSNDQAQQDHSSYNLDKVVAQMMLKKDRKIPNSVYKPHSEEVIILISSLHTNLHSSMARVIFNYPKYCQRQDTAPSFLQTEHEAMYDSKYTISRIYTQAELKENNLLLGFKMTESTHIYNSVVNSMKNAGVRIVCPSTSKWNVTWTGVTKPEVLKEMFRLQRINHFPQSFHLGRKDLMWKNIHRMIKQYPADYDICPTTYLMPEDYKKLVTDRDIDNGKALFIIKPNASSCGKGISVLGPQDPIPKKGGYLISKYVANPHLIDGLKYDLRIYVLVTSYDPLKIYLFKEGLVRFATEKYSTNANSLKKRFVHLTNYSVNKKAEGYVRNQDKAQQAQNSQDQTERSSKWNLLQLKKQFEKLGIDYAQVKGRIKDVIIKTLISVEPHIINSMSRCTRHRQVCFEVYGFDILLDSKLKPWLLEVNISPSLSSSSPLDKKIKTMLICDTLNLTGVQPFDRIKTLKEQEQMLRNRLLGLNRSPKNVKRSYEYLGGDGCDKILKIMGNDLTEDELQVIVDYEEEQLRKANFDLIYPISSNIPYYQQFFEFQRSGNEILWKYLRTVQQQNQQQSATQKMQPKIQYIV